MKPLPTAFDHSRLQQVQTIADKKIALFGMGMAERPGKHFAAFVHSVAMGYNSSVDRHETSSTKPPE